MPTNADQIKTNTPWKLKSRNESEKKVLQGDPQNQNNRPGNRNPGKASKESVKEGAIVDVISRNKAEKTTQSPTINRTQRKERNARKGDNNLYGSRSVKVDAARNESSQTKELGPTAIVSKKQTQKKSFQAAGAKGANLGKNS